LIPAGNTLETSARKTTNFLHVKDILDWKVRFNSARQSTIWAIPGLILEKEVLLKQFISCAPDVMGGTPVFSGTRVPVQTLLDYLEAGESIDEFLEGFPTVKREQVIAFLEEAKARMVADAA